MPAMHDVLTSLPRHAGGFSLNEVTFSAEVSAKGTVSPLDSGGELADKAGLTFTFTREPTGDADQGAAPEPEAP
ncbi:hypothetical protein V4Y04_28640 [Streptomyces sp. P9-A2]